MSILPFRGLAQRGILSDPSPYQLDLDAFSRGSNIRFHSNRAMRSPIWRELFETDSTFRPAHVTSYKPSTGFDLIISASDSGQIRQFASGVITDLTPAGFVAPSTPQAYNSTLLGDVLYINRPSAVPLYYGPSSTAFALLPNWDPTWTTRSLRAYSDFLVALNVTKGPQTNPSMVKWSDLTLAGLPPGSWNAADPTTNAGENILEDLDSPLVDSCVMRGINVLYSTDQVWSMTADGSQAVFEFARLFSDGGLMAPNCVVEVEGKHYVFGPYDIYVHDGTTKQSLVDNRNRDYIFRNLNLKKSEVCFAAYMPNLDEIVFGYNSGDADAAFPGVTCDFANKGAVYNIPGDTWSFIDLPNVCSITHTNITSTLEYASPRTATLSYATIGGSFYDQDSGFDQHPVCGSAAIPGLFTVSRIGGYDFMNKGSLAYAFSPEMNAPAYLERTGMALDQVGSDLTTYKALRRIYPLVSIFDNVPVTIEVGGSLTPSGAVSWLPPVTFDPVTQYKVDVTKGGRYLALRFTVTQPCDFEIAGFDADIYQGGNR
jgi:hypothetical protein